MIRILIAVTALILALHMAKGAEPDAKKPSAAADRAVVGIVLDFSQQSQCALSSTSTLRTKRAQVVVTQKGLQIAGYSSGTCQVPGSGVLKAAQNKPAVRPTTLITPVYEPSADDGC